MWSLETTIQINSKTGPAKKVYRSCNILPLRILKNPKKVKIEKDHGDKNAT